VIKIAEPQVYLVGKQTIDDAELDRFLADEGVETWTTDTEVAGEKLVEVAGRTCFDPDTELLTTRGWVRAADISPDEIVATLNPSTRMFEYQQIRRRHEYDFDGLLYAAAKRDVAFSVTPDHRQYASTGWDSDRRSFSFHTTADLVQKYARFDVLTAADGWQGVCPEVIDVETATYTQASSNHTGRNYGTSTRVLKPFTVQGTRKVIALAELFAHYVANGSVAEQPGTGGGIVIYGRECDEIDRLCDLLGLSHSRYSDKRNGCPRTHVSGGRTVGKLFRESCGSTYAHKQFPRWVLDLPREILAVVWDILVRTDGHTYTSNRQLFSTGSSVLAGQVQEILAKLGFSSAIKTQVVKATGTTCYAVYKKAGRPAIVHRSDVDKVAYTGKVYCVTTDNGIVYVRKNGIVHFSGNCYMSFAKPRPGGNKAYIDHILEVQHGSVCEHAVFNLILTGVSRSFTHELVRHRAGFGFSQLSQRYVDESDCRFVVPPLLKSLTKDEDHDCGIVTCWSDAIDRLQDTYKELADDLSDALAIRAWTQAGSPAQPEYENRDEYQDGDVAATWLEKQPAALRTAIRKQAREAARSVLPNATETKIFVTGNARALRHFIEMRGNKVADAEIQQVAGMVLDVLAKEAPNLFGDYTRGMEGIETPYRKV